MEVGDYSNRGYYSNKYGIWIRYALLLRTYYPTSVNSKPRYVVEIWMIRKQI